MTMTYAMTLDNAWELMTEDEMYDVNGGFLGWSGSKFLDNMVVIAKAIFIGISVLFGTVFSVGIMKALDMVVDTGVGFHAALATVGKNIVNGSVATAKWLYTALSASWGWTLGVLAVTLLVGVTVLGYVTL